MKNDLRDNILMGLKKYDVELYDSSRMFIVTEHENLLNKLIDKTHSFSIVAKCFIFLKYFLFFFSLFRYIKLKREIQIDGNFLIYCPNNKVLRESTNIANKVQDKLGKKTVFLTLNKLNVRNEFILNQKVSFIELMKLIKMTFSKSILFVEFKDEYKHYGNFDFFLIKLIILKNYIHSFIIKTYLKNVIPIDVNNKTILFNFFPGDYYGDLLNKYLLDSNQKAISYIWGSAIGNSEFDFYRQHILLTKNKYEITKLKNAYYEAIYDVGNISIGSSTKVITEMYDIVFYDTCVNKFFTENLKYEFYSKIFENLKDYKGKIAFKFHPGTHNRDVYIKLVEDNIKCDFYFDDIIGEDLLHSTTQCIIINSTILFEAIYLEKDIILLSPAYYQYINQNESEYFKNAPVKKVYQLDSIIEKFSTQSNKKDYADYINTFFTAAGDQAYENIFNVLEKRV